MFTFNKAFFCSISIFLPPLVVYILANSTFRFYCISVISTLEIFLPVIVTYRLLIEADYSGTSNMAWLFKMATKKFLTHEELRKNT